MSAKVNRRSTTNNPPDKAAAFVSITRYCAYQERSHAEVRQKLLSMKLGYDVTEELLSRLITEGFLNEERFAKAFAGGKFRIKHWGKLKIEQSLKAHNLSARCIAIGLREIDDDDYRRTLKMLVWKKSDSLNEDNLCKKRDGISKYVIGKGFEPELVWEVLREEIP